MSKFCTSCGSIMEDGAKFCGNCGAVNKQDGAPAPAAPQPQAYQPMQDYQVPQPQAYQPMQDYQAPQPQAYQPMQDYQAPQPQAYQPMQDYQAPQPPAYQPMQDYQTPQPPAYQPMQTPQPAPDPGQPAEKKSKKGLIIGISIAAVAVIAAVVVLLFIFVFNKDDSSSSSDSGSSSASAPTEKSVTKAEKKEEETIVEDSIDDDPFYGEDQIELKVWVPDQAIDVTNELCRAFIDQYPEKSIEITVLPQGEGDAAAQAMNDPDMAADVFGFSSDQLKRLCEMYILAPVAEPEIVAARNSMASVDAATVDGEIYAYPETADNGYYLVYDKSVVSDADAQSLEGILKACKKAGRKFIIDAGNGFYSCMFAFTGGMEIKGTDDEGVQIFNDYSEEQVVDSLEAFAKLFHDYSDVFVSSEVAKISTGFSGSRTVGAGIDGSWDTAANMNALGSDYGAAKLPTINVKGEDRQIISLQGYKLIGVNSRSDYPYAAQLLADYLTDENAQIERARELSWGPSNISAAEDDAVTNNPTLTALMEQSQYSVPMVDVAVTFWSPMGTLGNSLWKEADYSRETIKKNFEKTIDNILDL